MLSSNFASFIFEAAMIKLNFIQVFRTKKTICLIILNVSFRRYISGVKSLILACLSNAIPVYSAHFRRVFSDAGQTKLNFSVWLPFFIFTRRHQQCGKRYTVNAVDTDYERSEVLKKEIILFMIRNKHFNLS